MTVAHTVPVFFYITIVRVKFANYATIHCKGNPSLKAKGQRWEAQWAAEQYLEAGDMMFERSEFLSPQALRQAASGEGWTDWKMLQGNSWTKEAPNAVHDCPVFGTFLKKVQKARLQKEYKITD